MEVLTQTGKKYYLDLRAGWHDIFRQRHDYKSLVNHTIISVCVEQSLPKKSFVRFDDHQ